MKKIITMILIFGTMLLISVGAEAAKPIKVVATIGQITDIVRIIGQHQVDVKGLMGAGVDPHLYKASQSDVRKLAQADIILYSGLNLESKMGKIFEKMRRTKTVVELAMVIPKEQLLDSDAFAGHPDPHIWFDVTLWNKIAHKIRDVLIEYDPDNEALYRERAQAYFEKIKKLHTYVQQKVLEVQPMQRVLVTAHDAFRYFGRQYGFEVIGLQGVSTESQAGTRDMKKLADFITERKIRAMFVESSVPERSIKAVQQAVRARGWDVQIGGELFSDAMGDDGTFEGTYLGMVTHNINTIVDALKE